MSEKMTEGTTLNRRNVLKSAAVGAATSGMVGAASARTASYTLTKEQVERETAEYRDPETVRSLLEEQPEILEAAAEAGYIESASTDALDIETDFEAYKASGRDRDMALFNAKKKGDEVIPEVRVVREVDDGALSLAMRPTKGEGYALFVSDDGEADELYQSVSSKDDASTSNSCNECVINADCASNEECQTQLDSCCCDPSCPNMSCPVYKCVCVENCSSW